LHYLEWAYLKKTLAVLVLAVLIVAAIPAFVIPNVKADASEARVVSDSYYVASAPGTLAAKTGDLVVVGEIENVGSGIIGNVTLQGIALDSSGTTLGTATGMAFTFETTPTERVPFVIDFSPASSWSANVARVNVTILSVIDAYSPPPSGVNFVLPPTGIPGNPYIYTGTIINNGSQNMQMVWVVTSFYNSAGTVVALNWTSYLNYVNGYSSVFKHGSGNALHYVATPVDNTAAISNQIASASAVIDAIPVGTSSSSSGTPTSGGSTSSGAAPFPLLAVIVVVVIVVVAVAALLLFRKHPEKQPETQMPPPPPPPEV